MPTVAEEQRDRASHIDFTKEDDQSDVIRRWGPSCHSPAQSGRFIHTTVYNIVASFLLPSKTCMNTCGLMHASYYKFVFRVGDVFRI